jgi:isoquinoline 1-oxidoreductase beta subunit
MTDRREFLAQVALSSCALVIGLRPSRGAVRVVTPADPWAAGDWIAIDGDRTILTIGKQEMGQGARTALAMILADELDADWASIELVQAQPGPRYTDLNTGGSWGVGGSWRPLRQAGAAARAMLVSAAAARWGVDASACRTERSTVIHDATGRRLRYRELTADAARLTVPARAPFKAIADLRIVGTRVRRMDTPRIVTGAVTYGIDVRVPGMLHASIVRPPAPGATVKRVDPTVARRVAGVHSVTTISRGVAVVADSTWAALKGREALTVEWSTGAGAAFDSATHWRALEAAADQPGFVTRSDGDPRAAAAARTLQATYRYPFQVHAQMEPMNCIAHVHDGRCELWAPTQAPNRVQEQVATLLGVARDRVSVTPTLIGGGFGRRLSADYALEAAELSRAIGAPVQVLWTRSDDMRHGHFQMAALHVMSAGLDSAGRPVVWRHKKVSSLHNLSGPPTAEELKNPADFYRDSSWGVYDIPYAIPAIETSYVPVSVPVSIGPWRSVYSPSSTMARECFLDELAVAAGKDPIDYRFTMLGEPDVIRAGSLTIQRSRLRRVLELARAKSGWDTKPAAGHARGVACNVYDGDTYLAYVVDVSLRPSPAGGQLPFIVHRVVCAIDCGIIVNPLGVEQQVEGGVAWALSSMKTEITFRAGRAEQASWAGYPVLRLDEMPAVETHMVPSHGEQPYGVGEPPVPPLVPAVLNALFALTGRRIRQLPVRVDDLRAGRG